jgi:DNA polymerase III gamma/tau subunit
VSEKGREEKAEAYHTKYRPDDFDDVVGNDVEIQALDSTVREGIIHCYLFSGIGGIGKTTLARIAARNLGCDQVVGVDAASNSGVDAMRNINDMARPIPFGGGSRALIIDECHGLSKNAWDALLAATEEPPDHLFWFFCTTNPGKVPQTIKTRCLEINLKPLKEKEIEHVLNVVIKAERLKVTDRTIRTIVFEAQGSARQALLYLAKVKDLDERDVAAALKRVIETEPVRDFCRFLCSRQGKRSWSKAMAILDKLDEDKENPEGVRIVVANWVGKVLRSAKHDDEACYLLAVLDSFSVPYNSAEGIAPLLSSIGRVIYNNADTEEG